MKWLYLMPVVLTLMVKSADAQQSAHQVCMLVPQATQDCLKRFERQNQLSARISCLQDLLWNIVPDMKLDQKDRNFMANISRIIGVTEASAQPFTSRSGGSSTQQEYRSKSNLYPPSGKRIRKEYRLLTFQERARFHRALKRLYMDGIIDIFAKIHAEASDMHHGGASFLPWHRVYITMFEEILRLYDSSVSLPYWASTLDDVMDNPVNSILWTPEYFGNGDGIVYSGPAAGWSTMQGGLERDYGRFSTLLKRDQIQKVLTQCRLANISRPSASREFDLEGYHGGPHVWVGGDMSAFATTGYDPVFYMHHCYIDYIWEQFRRRQRYNCGVDPNFDYPEVPIGDSNHPDAKMTGFEWFTNKEGIESYWTDNWFTYEAEPECPNCCPGCSYPPPLNCDRKRNLCVSRSKLFDDQGRLIMSSAMGMRSRAEDLTSGRGVRPRNRGRSFDAPPNDGRTVNTALQDAMNAAPVIQQQQFQTVL